MPELMQLSKFGPTQNAKFIVFVASLTVSMVVPGGVIVILPDADGVKFAEFPGKPDGAAQTSTIPINCDTPGVPFGQLPSEQALPDKVSIAI
jgi:hypothetical protein